MKILAIGDFHGKFPNKLKNKLEKEDFNFIIGLGDYAGIDAWRPYIKYLFKLDDKTKRKSAKEFFGKKKFKELMKKDFKAGEKVLLSLNKLGKLGFYIFGNGDEEWYNYPFSKKILQAKKSRIRFLKKIKNLKEMTYKVRTYKETSFLGFGGYIDVVENWNKKKKRDREILKKVNKRIKKTKNKFYLLSKKLKKNSIFILHYTPKGFFDKISEKNNPYSGKSAGIKFFTKAIKKYKPKLVLCGHMHEYQGMKKLGKSIIINPGAAYNGKAAIIDFDEERRRLRKIKFIK